MKGSTVYMISNDRQKIRLQYLDDELYAELKLFIILVMYSSFLSFRTISLDMIQLKINRMPIRIRRLS